MYQRPQNKRTKKRFREKKKEEERKRKEGKDPEYKNLKQELGVKKESRRTR